jgi:ABC-type glycerol-3-phosphate transport system substrate-binding protein
MKKLNTILWLLTVVVVAGLWVSACGGAAEPPAPAQEAAPATEAPAQETAPTEAPAQESASGGEKVTLRLWSHQNAAFQKANDEIIAKFMAQNPNIEIKYENFVYDVFIQTLQTSMPAGTEADVIEMFGTWVCSYQRNLLPGPPRWLLLQRQTLRPAS